MKKLIFLLSLALAITTNQATAAATLPALNVLPKEVSISGISSGGFMAVQMGVAYPEKFKGIGVFAGGIYDCSQGNAQTAQGMCMKSPKDINVQKIVAEVNSLFAEGKVGDPALIKNQKVFIYHGTKDKVILPEASLKLKEFYQAFGVESVMSILTPSGHGFPSTEGKWGCGETQFPYMVNCGVDGAGDSLKLFYGKLEEKVPAKDANLKAFNQSEFGLGGGPLGNDGFVYIPESCQKEKCRLHIALHGCLQSPMMVQKNFTALSGFNSWAESLLLETGIQWVAGIGLVTLVRIMPLVKVFRCKPWLE
ncbi:MAG: prolyl oligopeptidase family serine peptidase [Bdellovibrionota bacterium]